MKKINHNMLAAMALLGFTRSVSAEEPSTKPTATVTITKPAIETKRADTAKSAPQVQPATPKPVTTPKLEPIAEAPRKHIVSKGETLTGIAHRNSVSVGKLALWNRLADPNKLSIGQSIEIPTANAMPQTPKSRKPAKPMVAPAKPAPTTDPEEIHVTLSSK